MRLRSRQPDHSVLGVTDPGRIQDFEHTEEPADPEPLLFYRGKLGGYQLHE